MKNKIYNILAVIWFFGVILGTLFLGVIFLLMIFFSNIVGMLKSGFSTPIVGFMFAFLFSIIFGITGAVAPFRRCYYKLPWLYPLSMLMTIHFYILSIAEAILSKGFSVMGDARHALTIVIMIVQVIICRVVVCLYIKKKPMILHKYDIEE